MIESLPQTENKKKCDHMKNCTKSLSVPTLKNGTLFIGYLNAVISILFIIVSSSALARDSAVFVGTPGTYGFYIFANSVVSPSLLTIGLVSFGFTALLIAGTHMEKPTLMRVYFNFGVIGFLLSVGALIVIVLIMAGLGQLGSMIFAMQNFFFLGVYVVQLHVIHLTIERLETPINVQETHVKDDKDTSLPPYERSEYAPRLTVVT